MLPIKTKKLVGALVMVPARVFMGVRALGGVARIIRIARTNARGAALHINCPVALANNAELELIATVAMVAGCQRQYYLCDEQPASTGSLFHCPSSLLIRLSA